MELLPKLKYFMSKIFEEKISLLKEEREINNRIIYLPYAIEDLVSEINIVKDNRFDNLKDLLDGVEKKSKYNGIGVETYEVKDLNAFRKEFERLRKMP